MTSLFYGVTDAFYDLLSKLSSFISVESIYHHYNRKVMSVNIKSSGKENSHIRYITSCVSVPEATLRKNTAGSLSRKRDVASFSSLHLKKVLFLFCHQQVRQDVTLTMESNMRFRAYTTDNRNFIANGFINIVTVIELLITVSWVSKFDCPER